MDWKAGLDAALLGFLQQRCPDAVSLVSWCEEGVTEGCETCAWTSVQVEFIYRNTDGLQRYYRFDGPFHELIQRLTTEVPV